ncbi:MAG: dihydrodipicolinate reductase C-terminal domain-containing protein [Gemmatimonadota bacterium]
MRVAIVGLGRMGHAVEAEAHRQGHEVVASLSGRAADQLVAEQFSHADVAIEFTRPDTAAANVERLITLGVPVVSGTTGWDAQLPRLRELVTRRSGALLHAPNFSVGMALMTKAAALLSQHLTNLTEFDAAIHETHHRKKVDIPSGTALALQRTLRAANPTREFPISSSRVGWVAGTHTLSLDAPFETIELTHAVRDRAVFAAGSLHAAAWLAGRSGFFTFHDMLFGGPS